MKKFILFLITVVMVVSICSCTSNRTESFVVEGKPSMFVKVEDGPSWNVYYHRETKVMYTVSYGSYNNGNFTLLVNPDGSPMIWEGEN